MTNSFAGLADIRAALADLPAPDRGALDAARARDAVLTKPGGALGRLEDIAIWMAGWQGRARPAIDRPQIAVFAGNHGVAARGVSAFPPEVTVQMVANFEAGGAAVNQLARVFGATMTVVPLALERPTTDFTQGAAMTGADCAAAFGAGWDAVDARADLFVAGEMGIGNTTAAAAIAGALYGGDWVGAGTGVAGDALEAKRAVVAAGIARHAAGADAVDILCRLGGREIAAMAGAITRARHLRIPVILDGFICCAAAAVLRQTNPAALDHCLAGHRSAEQAHARMLQQFGMAPLLSLDLRLGEGSGAALAIGVIKGAVACHSGMATFAEAGVADG